MFTFKKKYFVIINNTKDINLNKIRLNHKFFIVYRNKEKNEEIHKLLKFRMQCKNKGFKFLVANNLRLNSILKGDGIYLSSYNKSFKSLSLKKNKKIIIGSAHNIKEISEKQKQGCNYIVVSKLFKVNYAPDEPFIGVVRFNNLIRFNRNIIPLGGIGLQNLNKMKIVTSEGFAIMSEIKKKPAIASRLF